MKEICYLIFCRIPNCIIGYIRGNLIYVSYVKIGDVYIYSNRYFANKENHPNRKSVYSIHHFDGSWTTGKHGYFYTFAREHDLMHVYRKIEQFIVNLKRIWRYVKHNRSCI